MSCTTCGYRGGQDHDDPIDCVDFLRNRIAELEALLQEAIVSALSPASEVVNLVVPLGWRDRVRAVLCEEPPA
jgi:hypothetical protein